MKGFLSFFFQDFNDVTSQQYFVRLYNYNSSVEAISLKTNTIFLLKKRREERGRKVFNKRTGLAQIESVTKGKTKFEIDAFSSDVYISAGFVI